jgi:hypothetical protein
VIYVDQLTVVLNEAALYSIATPSTFETTDSFGIVLDNNKQAVHVHLNLDEALSSVASLRTTNHYVERNRIYPVTVDIDTPATEVSGRLKIATGYGAEVAYTTVTVRPAEERSRQVAIDESLSRPTTSTPAEPGLVTD